MFMHIRLFILFSGWTALKISSQDACDIDNISVIANIVEGRGKSCSSPENTDCLSGSQRGCMVLYIDGQGFYSPSVYIGSAECLVHRESNDSLLICLLSPTSDDSLLGTPTVINITTNGTTQCNDTEWKFTYKEELDKPTISSISPLASIISGYITQTVIGTGFLRNDSCNFTNMSASSFYGDKREEEGTLSCQVVNDTLAFCNTTSFPLLGADNNRVKRSMAKSHQNQLKAKIRQKRQLIQRDFFFEVTIGQWFVSPSRMNVANNPEFNIWDDTLLFRTYRGDDRIDITGNHIGIAVSVDDFYTVTVGVAECRIVDSSRTHINCEPPQDVPDPVETAPSGLHPVEVRVGRYHVTIGNLQYVTNFWDDPRVRRPIIISVAVVGSVLLLIIIYLVLRKLDKDPFKHLAKALGRGREARPNVYERPDERPFMLPDDLDADIKARLQGIIVDESRLSLGVELGHGNFGKVYKGTFINQAGQHISVAVKTLVKDEVSSADYRQETMDFLKEATIMRDFNNEHVLSLMAVVIRDNKPFVILPLMENGDLKTFVSNIAMTFTCQELLEFGLQVAQGMAYLSSQKFVHRDLAARNCMVNATRLVKIADFGLARDIYEDMYYAVENKKRALPVKWMAPESLISFKFTIKTDVWSYGVTLWEIITRGTRPYADVENYSIKDYLRRGRRLEQPKYCPEDIYNIMLCCWHQDPDRRPEFNQIIKDIKAFFQLVAAEFETGQVDRKPRMSNHRHTAAEYEVMMMTAVPVMDDYVDVVHDAQVEAKGPRRYATKLPGDEEHVPRTDVHSSRTSGRLPRSEAGEPVIGMAKMPRRSEYEGLGTERVVVPAPEERVIRYTQLMEQEGGDASGYLTPSNQENHDNGYLAPSIMNGHVNNGYANLPPS